MKVKMALKVMVMREGVVIVYLSGLWCKEGWGS